MGDRQHLGASADDGHPSTAHRAPDHNTIRVAVLTNGAGSVRGVVTTVAHLGDRGIGGLEIDLADLREVSRAA